MTTTTAPERPFSFVVAVGALEYAQAVLRADCARYDQLGISHQYDDRVIQHLERIADYLKTEYAERCGCDFPDVKEAVE
jgi:hypothetical protein